MVNLPSYNVKYHIWTASLRAMPSKKQIADSLHVRRGLSEGEAAVYVGISPTYFRDLVGREVMPKPRLIGRRRVWDIIELNAAFDELPRDGHEAEQTFTNSWADYS